MSRTAKKSPARATRRPTELVVDRAGYDTMMAIVRAAVTAGDTETALSTAGVAAHAAWTSSIGVLADLELDQLVLAAARGSEPAPTVERDRSHGRVLHVLTEWADSSSAVASARRWIDRDHRRSEIALTNHAGATPDELTTFIATAGGSIHHLRRKSRGAIQGWTEASLVDRVTALRAAMDGVDLVVLHTTGYDPVAIAAIHRPGARPPVIVDNHTDTRFALGLAGADVVVGNRMPGNVLATRYRGVVEDQLALLPIPAEQSPMAMDRDDLRARMRFDSRSVVAMTVARPDKLRARGELGFTDLAIRLLKAVPELTLLVVGPLPEGPWKQLATRFPGRVHALGPVPQASSLYTVADLYLDSYPESAPTAMLDAAATRLPVLALQASNAHGEMWVTQSPQLPADSYLARSVEDYVARAKRLARSRPLREQLAEQIQELVMQAHAGRDWSESLDAVYEQARRAPAVEAAGPAPIIIDSDFSQELLRHARSQGAIPFDSLIAPYASVIQAGLRAQLYASQLPTDIVWLRVRAGWEGKRAWVQRALSMAADDPRLALSFPAVRGGDHTESLSLLRTLADEAGLTDHPRGHTVIETVEATAGRTVLNLPSDHGTLDFVQDVLAQLPAVPESDDIAAVA